jgi:hypothetical protein
MVIFVTLFIEDWQQNDSKSLVMRHLQMKGTYFCGEDGLVQPLQAN